MRTASRKRRATFNIRRRYPLATFGYCYLVTGNVPRDEPAAFERIKDMCNKLRSLSTADETASYDATCLLVVEIDKKKVELDEDLVPEDLSPDRFFETLLTTLFSRSPVLEHGSARELWEGSQPAEKARRDHDNEVAGPGASRALYAAL